MIIVIELLTVSDNEMNRKIAGVCTEEKKQELDRLRHLR